jgi:hypothetical protein
MTCTGIAKVLSKSAIKSTVYLTVYIIRILQHFATKLRNITNFVMFFQAVENCLSRLVYRSIFFPLGNRSIEIVWTFNGNRIDFEYP